MNTITNLIEYYEELYFISDDQKSFYNQVLSEFQSPAKILRIGCGTGAFEHLLAKNGADVTGIETFNEMLESANRRRRFPNMAVRYFQMTTLEMTRFLGKNFYNIISCLNDRLIFIHDITLLRKFLYDCKSLLADKGVLILQLSNFSLHSKENSFSLQTRESIRSKLFTKITRNEKGICYLQQDLESSSSKISSIIKDEEVLTITSEQIQEYAKEAGFTNINFYDGFTGNPFNPDLSLDLVCKIS